MIVPTPRSRNCVVTYTIIVLVLLVLATLILSSHESARAIIAEYSLGKSEQVTEVAKPAATSDKLHLLMPASDGNINLCKTLMTAHVLGYPTPTLIAWNEIYDTGHTLGGGAHMAKISRTLDHLESMDASQDNDLVMMIDAYDIWFQLRPEVLISRYRSINAKANERLRQRLGRAIENEGIEQTIVFGAGKRCAPNQIHTVACYPVPDSPVPMDTYGNNTDKPVGRNRYTNHRQRYLNSGYIIGPVRDMRKMFERANKTLATAQGHSEWDNGSMSSYRIYGGSDQSIFNRMLGEQEFQREVMRRRHLTSMDRIRGLAKFQPYHLEGILIEDPLNPPFTHEPATPKPGRPDEFGMGLDYFSDLGHQTMNANEDARYITRNSGIADQVGKQRLFECPSRATEALPDDIRASRPPFAALHNDKAVDATGWADVALFTNICMDTIPVMIHRNGDKDARIGSWHKTWLLPHGRQLMKDVLKSHGAGAYTQGKAGKLLEWDGLCPAEYDEELYREGKPGQAQRRWQA